ncbi:MAG: class I SAM-dependent methyltransferase [Anaerolineales bacterium]|nr:class I SAM-dependent methyltransferase [Anaerolineales bacterium]
MKLEEYEIMFRVEDTLWWYRGMQAITRALIERTYSRGAGLKILDAGCGTGAAISYLADYGTVTGLDFMPLAVRLAQRRAHTRLVCGSVLELPFASASFDLVTSLDVLPMLDARMQRDVAALNEMARLLKVGGRLLVRVAAYDWLRGAHDRLWDVQHRYTLAEMRTKLERVGLTVEHGTYANMWLFPLAALKRLSEPLFPNQEQSDIALSAGLFNGVLAAILASEASLAARRALPFGLSLIMVAQKS